ncbi:MAG: hypothetical protein GXY55_16290 [Phycisphaerae bacterium]|nr:hypothetical protein [Phycisphaerae bacterium]
MPVRWSCSRTHASACVVCRSAVPDSTRRLLALCARLERGNAFARALEVCVLNKAPAEDRKDIAETFEHHVGPLG